MSNDDLKQIRCATGMMPAASDMWLALIILLWASPWVIGWKVWVVLWIAFAAEKICGLCTVWKYLQEKG